MSPSSRPKRIHPTRAKLIATVVELRQTHRPEEISVEQVLDLSGISRGSLYHHFEDFFDLIEAAELLRFTEYVDLSIEKLSAVVQGAQSADDVRTGLRKATRATQNATLEPLRFDRIGAITRADSSPRFRQALGLEQDRLTTALQELIEHAQANGWFRSDLDARAISVLIQAYTLGRIVDDISPTKIEPEAWNLLIDAVVENALMGTSN